MLYSGKSHENLFHCIFSLTIIYCFKVFIQQNFLHAFYEDLLTWWLKRSELKYCYYLTLRRVKKNSTIHICISCIHFYGLPHFDHPVFSKQTWHWKLKINISARFTYVTAFVTTCSNTTYDWPNKSDNYSNNTECSNCLKQCQHSFYIVTIFI